MRIKPIIKYHISTTIRYVVIFYSVMVAVTLIGVILSVSFATNIHLLGSFSSSTYDGNTLTTQSWSMSILPFMIFMTILTLGLSQKDTRFLITRSVSRKEIFVTSAIYLIPIAAVMAFLQIITIYMHFGISSFMTDITFTGITGDFQSFQAPNMNNPIVFFLVSMAMFLSISAKCYLIGTFYAKWKIPTIIVLAVSAITGIACISFDGFVTAIGNGFSFMFTDDNNGLWIVLKHIIISIVFMLAAFPVMRRITAAKNVT